MDNVSILIVEDDVKLGNLLKEYLESQGYEVGLEHRGDIAVPRILHEAPTLLILDLQLPGMDGLEVCREIRSSYDGQILMLTARQTEMDQIVGLEMGADDYVTKPVEPRLLLAHIRSLLRRYNREQTSQSTFTANSSTIVLGDFSINSITRDVYWMQTPLELTAAEFELLWFLRTFCIARGQP